MRLLHIYKLTLYILLKLFDISFLIVPMWLMLLEYVA